MTLLTGHLLVPTVQNPDRGLWFIFHHEPDGVLAFDLTQEHPEIPYAHFETLLGHENRTVLLGGPTQSNSALLILHNKPSGSPDSYVINDDFAFLSYRYILIPGQPPQITKTDNTPVQVTLDPSADVVVAVGFRVWEMDDLEEELKNWQWNFIPATPDLVFHTQHQDRLEKARLSIN